MTDNTQRCRDILEFFIKCSCEFIRRSPNNGLSVREIKLLNFLEENKGRNVSVGEIGEKMELTMPATSKLLKVLETKDFITRSADRMDRRTIHVSVTPRGSDTIREGWEYFSKRIDTIVEYMGEQKADEFITLSKLYLEALHEAGYLTEKEDAAC